MKQKTNKEIMEETRFAWKDKSEYDKKKNKWTEYVVVFEPKKVVFKRKRWEQSDSIDWIVKGSLLKLPLQE